MAASAFLNLDELVRFACNGSMRSCIRQVRHKAKRRLQESPRGERWCWRKMLHVSPGYTEAGDEAKGEDAGAGAGAGSRSGEQERMSL